MKVKINEIRKICEKILRTGGVKLADAKIIVDDYLEGELLNKKTHGLLAFTTGYKNAIKNKDRKLKIIKNSGNYALINGNHQKGQLTAKKARELLIAKAKKHGIAMVGVYNEDSFLRPGSQAEFLARKNLIGLVFHNGGGSLVPPFGGIDPIISTNPIGYAIPTAKQPIVLDMAISVRAWREVILGRELGKKLPPEAYLDKKGKVTTDPWQANAVMAFGGYKGFALGLLIEILSGSLVGNGVGLRKNGIDKSKIGHAWRGTLYLAIDPGKFVNINKFKRENSQLIKELKHSRKRKGVKEILIPGEKSYYHKITCFKRGWLDVDKKIISKIYSAANL